MAAFAIFMFICVVTSEVTANPLLQALTSQSCQLCQPNSLRNQLASLLFQPNNNQPCPQMFMAQNPAPQSMIPPQNCHACPPQSKNDQCNPVLSKILSNPTLKSILDPNTKLINQNGVEVPRNGPNGVPNVINNYFIVPPELLIDDAKCKKVTEDRRANRRQQRNNRKKSAEVTTDRNVDMKRVNEIEDVKPHDEVRERKPKRRRNKNKVSEVKVKVQNETVQDTSQIEIPLDVKKDGESATESNDYQVLEVTTPYTPYDTTTDNKHIINIAQNRKDNSEDHKTGTQTEPTEPIKIKLNDGRNRNDKPRRRNKTRIKTQPPNRNTKEDEAINEFCRKFPNIPEKLVRDLLSHMRRQIEKEQLGINFNTNTDKAKHQKISDNTEEVSKTRNNRRRKIRRGKKRKPQNKAICDPTTTTIELTPTIAQETTTEKLTKVEDKITKPTEPTVLEETETQTDIETTTPKYYKNNDINKKFNDYYEESVELETTDDKFKNKEEESIEIVTSNQQVAEIPDLGSEDVVPTIYLNGLVDDYYPDFTGDNQYYSSEDLSLIKFEDDRYHYTTDRNYELEELNRERRKLDNNFKKDVNARIADKIIFRLNNNKDTARPRNARPEKQRSRNVESDTERARLRQRIKFQNEDRRNLPSRRQEKINLGSIERTESPIAKTEEIQFRTPPTLEKIDFETKPVNKNLYFHDDLELADKVSTYSDAKTPEYVLDKTKTDVKPKKKHLDEIETVFARSKVVTYGRMSEEVTAENDSSDVRDNFDDKTVVLAKSVKDGFWRV